VVSSDGYLYICGGLQRDSKWVYDFSRLALANFEATGTSTWEALTDLPSGATSESPAGVGVSGARMAELNGLIHHMGGRHFSAAGGGVWYWSDEVKSYDPATQQWSSKASLNIGRMDFRPAVLGGYLYVLGGIKGPPQAISLDVERYDPATNTWTTKASIPEGDNSGVTNRKPSGFGCVVYSGRIYIYGGYDAANSAWPNYQYTNDILYYDPSSDSWTRLAASHDMPVSRSNFGYAVSGDRFYLFAGTTMDSSTHHETAAWYYDATSGTWTQVADLPTSNPSVHSYQDLSTTLQAP